MKNLRILFTVGVIWLILLSTTGCDINKSSGITVHGSGNLDTQEMDYQDFTKIDAGHAFEVKIDRVDSFSVHITLDDNLFDYLVIEKTGDTLYIDLESNINYQDTTQQATITLPDLRVLKLHGASRGDVSGFSSTDSLQVELSGASRLFLEDVEAGDTQFDISGASRVTGTINMADCDLDLSGASWVELEGSSYDASINASGASSVLLDDFMIDNADISLSGASSAIVSISGTIDADLSGASSIEYFGNPILGSVTMSGGSTMHQR